MKRLVTALFIGLLALGARADFPTPVDYKSGPLYISCGDTFAQDGFKEYCYTNGYVCTITDRAKHVAEPLGWIERKLVTTNTCSFSCVRLPTGMKLDEWVLNTADKVYLYLSDQHSLTKDRAAAAVYYGTTITIPGNTISVTDVFTHWDPYMYLMPCFSWLSYKLQYDLNGGTGTVPSAETYIYTNKVTVATNVPTRAGWSFTGWSTNANAKTCYAAGKSNCTGKTFGATTNGLVTLYANWTQNVYHVSFNYRNAQEQDVSTKVMTLGTEAAKAPTDLSVDFERWDTDFSCVVSNFTVGAIYKSYYTLEFDPNGATNTMDKVSIPRDVHTNLPPCTLLKPGCHFEQWTYEDDNERVYGLKNQNAIYNLGDTNQILTLKATWTANQYTIYFDANGGTGTTGKQPLKYGETCALVTSGFSRKGYAFSGWNTKADGSGTSYAAEEKVTSLVEEDGGTITLYAQWTANGYTVAFDANGGTGTMEATNVIYDVAFALPASGFTRTGYTFAGWGATSNATELAAAGTVVSNLTEIADATNTLYASWTANTYTITYQPNGVFSTGGTNNSMEPTVATYDTPVTLRTNAFVYAGYVFGGWKPQSDGSGTNYPDAAVVTNLATGAGANTNVDLWAQWSPVRYTIRFDANGGEGTMEAMTNCLYDVDIALPSNTFTRTGRTFNGWNNGAYADGATVRNLARTDGAEVTLTASWELADGDLRAALDLSTTDESLALTTDYWSVMDNADAVGGTCLKATSTSTLAVNIATNGTLAFNWQTVNPSSRVKCYVFKVSTTNKNESALLAYSNVCSEDWASDTITVTNAPTCLVLMYTTDSEAATRYALLDNFVWTPAGASPEPTADDAPVISALTSSGSGLALTFAADSRFNYQLLGTNELSSGACAAEWPIIKNVEGTNGTVTLDQLLDANEPQMFYKVRVIQKQ